MLLICIWHPPGIMSATFSQSYCTCWLQVEASASTLCLFLSKPVIFAPHSLPSHVPKCRSFVPLLASVLVSTETFIFTKYLVWRQMTAALCGSVFSSFFSFWRLNGWRQIEVLLVFLSPGYWISIWWGKKKYQSVELRHIIWKTDYDIFVCFWGAGG